MDDLRKIQLIQIQILEKVIEICEKEHIKYYLFYGTLLGAVRHSGFIPWDDDTDIVMPRGDFERFILVAEKYLDNRFFLHTVFKDPNYYSISTRIRRNGTEYIPDCYSNAQFINNGIWLDIFALDYADSPALLLTKIKFYVVEHVFKPLIVYSTGKPNPGSGKKIKSMIGLILGKCISSEKAYKLCVRVMKKNRGEYYVSYDAPYRYEKNYFRVDNFGEGIKMDFNGIRANCPEHYDMVLTRLYDNYLSLPPVEERIGHVSSKVIIDDDIIIEDLMDER